MSEHYSMTSQGLEETALVAGKILKTCRNHKIFAIFGGMGAGKTTLVKGLCAHLGVEEPVSSPTFALVNEYGFAEGKVFHFDFYRIRNVEEAHGIGFWEYIDSGHYCFIEWPEMIEGLLPEDCVQIHIHTVNPDTRRIEWIC